MFCVLCLGTGETSGRDGTERAVFCLSYCRMDDGGLRGWLAGAVPWMLAGWLVG